MLAHRWEILTCMGNTWEIYTQLLYILGSGTIVWLGGQTRVTLNYARQSAPPREHLQPYFIGNYSNTLFGDRTISLN